MIISQVNGKTVVREYARSMYCKNIHESLGNKLLYIIWKKINWKTGYCIRHYPNHYLFNKHINDK
jgi:hypothetical protein